MMKKSRIWALAIGLLAFGLFAACEPQGKKIAYVNAQKVIDVSKAGKDLTRKVKDHTDKINKKTRPELERLQREEKDLVQQQSVLSSEAFRKKEQSFRRKFEKFQRKLKNEERNLQKGGGESLTTIYTVISQICKELLEKHNFDIILRQNAVLNGNEDFDLTSEVIELLDERLKEVDLVVPTE